jgi:MFS family permease
VRVLVLGAGFGGARAVPSVVFALWGGVVVDRVSRRLAMLSSDVVRGLAVGVVAILLARQNLRLWELIAMSAIFGAADAFFVPASMAIVPSCSTTIFWSKETPSDK